MRNLKFSVLLSVYKAENPTFLQECLDSVLSNSVVPDELVIVEDGPLTTLLYETLEKYEAESNTVIKRVRLKENVGLGQALALGLQQCTYNIIARMDTDDICMSNRFELQLAEFQKDDELVLLGGHIDEFNIDPQQTTSTRKVPLTHEKILRYAKKRNPFNHMTVMFKKDKVLAVGNYRKLTDIGYEDYDLWVRILKAGFKVQNLDLSLVKMRTGTAMLKRRGNKRRLRTALYFRKHLKDTGFITKFEYIRFSLYSIAFSFSPIILKQWLYKNILRN